MELITMQHFDDTNYTGNPTYNWQEADGEEGFLETYEPYISTVLEIAKTAPKTVWTVVDNADDPDMSIIAGYHLVNRIHYFISNEEWKDPYEAYMWQESECDWDE